MTLGERKGQASMVIIAGSPFFYLRLSTVWLLHPETKTKTISLSWTCSVKWDMSCMSQEERTVVKGQVPVGFLVMEGWVQVDLSSPRLFVGPALVLAGCWDNL